MLTKADTTGKMFMAAFNGVSFVQAREAKARILFKMYLFFVG
jgi:hypothetical protein